MVTARGYFLRAHETDPGDTGALVSLYLTDAQYFPGLSEQVDWFPVLEESLRSRVLQASDLAALEKLAVCLGNGGCSNHRRQIETLIEELLARNPREVRLYLVKYNYLKAIDAPRELLVEVLSLARVIAPAHASVRYLSVKEAWREGDVAMIYDIAGNWLAHDVERRDLPLIKSLFVVPEAPP